MEFLGSQLLAELYNCNPKLINEVGFVQRSMEEAAKWAGATIVDSVFHQYNPQGVSGVVVIKESHLAIHCWPEFKFVSIDLFTCGSSVSAEKALSYLKQQFQAQDLSYTSIGRGERKLIAPNSDTI